MLWWDIIEHVFLVFFILELTLRITLMTPKYFLQCQGVDIAWDFFDVFIVALGVMDFICGQLAGDNWEQNQGGFETVFRMVRMVRILRVFRIIRFVKQLYVLGNGFALAAIAVFWVALLMAAGLYVCSVVLVRTLRSMQSTVHTEFFHERFGTIPDAMFTL